MKKFTLALMALLALTIPSKAQLYVSTESSNRNVILEEFTGRGCQFCPDGHRIANSISNSHPGRFWAINIHAGSYALTSYPNFITPDGNTIHNGFSINGYPCGVVNRGTSSAIDRDLWANRTNTQLNQTAECNVAGRVVVDPATRKAVIIVEVYYTGNSAADQNYLTVAMLQDSILGTQSGGSTFNPSQMINGQYVHMHVLRDVITESAWGDAIAPTTQGTLITKVYVYDIPGKIGGANGVEVNLNHISFLAWVSEQEQGVATRPILNACKLQPMDSFDEALFPNIESIHVHSSGVCSQTRTVSVGFLNAGSATLTSMTLNVELAGETKTIDWEGNVPSYGKGEVEFEIEAPFGSNLMTVDIAQVNGQSFQNTLACSVEVLEWVETEASGDYANLELFILQDKFGGQTSWKFFDSNGTVLVSGGPYNTLPGGGTAEHHEQIELPANECVKFTIYDSGGNGICCGNNGDGYYQIIDGDNNVIIDGDGNFGYSATHMLSIKESPTSVVTMEPIGADYNTAQFTGKLIGNASGVGFEYYRLFDHIIVEVEGELDGATFTATVDNLESDEMYSVRAFATVSSGKVYGEEIHFHTWVEGVSEFEQSLMVYPNPAQDLLNVEGTMTKIEVYNTLGQCLMSKQVNEQNVQISLAGFDNGIYFLRIYNNGETAVRKFSVNL